MEQSVKHKVVPPLGRARVLIAEDDALIAIDLETVLAEAGAEVVGPCLSVEDQPCLEPSSIRLPR
jgi:hypothetical protein